jgi:acetyltransferase-like isoleucine patch superfamily enzyme
MTSDMRRPLTVALASYAEHFVRRVRIEGYRRRGLQISDDCELNGTPDFGSEPFLISIGKHVRMSADIHFVTHDGATWVFRHLPGYEEVIKFGRIVVHDNCFIGMGAIILPGVSIGPNAVVAAGSLVTKDVPPNTIVGGNPARVLTTVEEYAQKTLATQPAYDRKRYEADREAELLRLYPRPW